jgi:hypothetical protein
VVQALLGHTQLWSTTHYLDHPGHGPTRELLEAAAKKNEVSK